MDNSLFEILLIEDNPGDVKMIQHGLEHLALAHRLRVAGDGLRALEVFADTDYTPDIILLDLGLPKVSGGTVYRAAKANERISHIPVVILRSEYDAGQAGISDPDYCSGRHANLVEFMKVMEFIQSILNGAPQQTRQEVYINPRLLDSSSELSQ